MSREGAPDRGFGSPPESSDGPVTTTVVRRVKPGHEPFYERFLESIIAAASRFPGHLGVEVFRPDTASGGEYRVVYRFDTGEHLRAWLDSDERAAWLERGATRDRPDANTVSDRARDLVHTSGPPGHPATGTVQDGYSPGSPSSP